MLKIAQENNLSETAFAVKNKNFYELRWFTPKNEIVAAKFEIVTLNKSLNNAVLFSFRSNSYLKSL